MTVIVSSLLTCTGRPIVDPEGNEVRTFSYLAAKNVSTWIKVLAFINSFVDLLLRKFIIIIMVLWKVFAVTAVHFSIAAVHFAITAVRFAKAAVHFVITAVHLAITAVHFAITAGNLAVTAVHFVITAVHFVITAVHLFQAVYLCWTGRQLVMRMMNTRQRRRRTTTLLTAARKELLTSRLCSWEARSRSIRYWASLTHTQS